MKKIFLLLVVALLGNFVFGQLNENFEGNWPPNDWTIINVDGSGYFNETFSNMSAHSGTQGAQAKACQDDYIITPKLLPISGDNSFGYWARVEYSGYSNGFEIMVSTTGTDIGDFIQIADYPNFNLSVWTNQLEDLSAYNGQEIYVAIHVYYSQSISNDFGFDDISGPALFIPSCPEPTLQSQTNITLSSAELDWTENGSATSWVIEWMPVGTSQGSGTIDTITSKPYMLTNLSISTTYDWYIQTNCGGGDFSDWVGESTFTTDCDSVSVYPWIETFTSWPPDCWLLTGGTFNWEYHAANSCAKAKYYSYSNPNNAVIISPTLDVNGLTSPELIFNWSHLYRSSYPLDELDVLVSDDNGSNWISVWNKSGSDFNSDDGATTTSPGSFVSSGIVDLSQFSSTLLIKFNGISGYGPDVFIDDVTVREAPSCAEPTLQVASYITTTTTNIGWTENGSATLWIIEWMPTGGAQGTGTFDTVTSNPFTINSLNASTSYDWYVRSYCGDGDLSTWLGPNTFTTECSLVTSFPAFENFETFTSALNATGYENCWSTSPSNTTFKFRWNVDTEGTATISTGPAIDHTTGNTSGVYLHTEASNGVVGNEAYVYTALYDLTNITSPQITFWYHMYGSGMGELHVDIDNGSGWILDVMSPLIGQQQSLQSDPWLLKTVDLSSYAGQFVKFRFRSIRGNNWNGDMAIDDFMIDEISPCPTPTIQADSNITLVSADLYWSENGAATNWDIEYGPLGFTQGTGTIITATSNPFTLSGLSASTTYNWFLRADCESGGGTGQSIWMGPATFTTTCNTHELPISQGFNATDLPGCWSDTIVSDPGRNPVLSFATFGISPYCVPVEGTHLVQFDSYICADGAETRLESPEFSTMGISSARVLFAWHNDYDYSANTDEGVTLQWSLDGILWNDGTFYPRYNSITGWSYKIYNLPPETLEQNSVYIGFLFHAQRGRNCFLDDIVIEETPDCADPNDQSETSITATSAVLNWIENGTATTWEIEWGPSWFTQGTGNIDTITENPYLFDSLLVSTTYDWYVRADCGNEYTEWVGPHTFTTLCNTHIAPFNESFTNPMLPDCWHEDGPEYWSFYINASHGAEDAGDHTPGGGTQHAWVNGSYPNSSGIILKTPLINPTELAEPYFSFWYFSNNTNNPGDNNTLHCDLSINGGDWTNLLTYTGDSPNWQIFSHDLSSYNITSTVQFRFIIDETASPSDYNDILIDDISINEAPTCPDPLTQSEIIITPSSVTCGWIEYGNANNWEIEWMPTGNAKGSGTVISTSTNPYILNNLSSSTTYDWYVRSNCGDGEFSNWIGPNTFTTACAAITSFLYTEDFENAGIIPNCWVDDPANLESWKYGTFATFAASTDHGIGSGYFAWIDDYSPHFAVPSYLLSPYYNTTSLNSPQLSFYYWIGRGATGSTIEIDVYDGNEWQTGLMTLSANDGWAEAILNLTAYSNTELRIRFSGNEQPGYYGCDISIDDVTIKETPYAIWTGTNGTDWNIPSNWSENTIPTSTDNVIIPNVTNSPVINGISVQCYSITIENNATMSIENGGSITVLGFDYQ
jgi:large repetitive protein